MDAMVRNSLGQFMGLNISNLKLIAPNESTPSAAEAMLRHFEPHDGDSAIIAALESIMTIFGLRTVDDAVSFIGQHPDKALKLVSKKTLSSIGDYISSRVF
jgi:hypothetical protein